MKAGSDTGALTKKNSGIMEGIAVPSGMLLLYNERKVRQGGDETG